MPVGLASEQIFTLVIKKRVHTRSSICFSGTSFEILEEG
ncbi:hypothetical protein CP03DC35_0715 [Chlamydia psittaci 03DC35]|nr:hypothetical protein CP02DC22_0723 [Chlamydia psittaci 02DC22]EPJ31295.1 hypothetical protein CP03DC35_0715 [Chlamydia psittaci 03DC35]